MPIDPFTGQVASPTDWGSVATWVLAGAGVVNLALLIWNLSADRMAKLSATLFNLVRSASVTASEAAELREEASKLREKAIEAQEAADREREQAIEARERAAQAEAEAMEARLSAEAAMARAQRNEQELQALRELLTDAMARRATPPAPPATPTRIRPAPIPRETYGPDEAPF